MVEAGSHWTTVARARVEIHALAAAVALPEEGSLAWPGPAGRRRGAGAESARARVERWNARVTDLRAPAWAASLVSQAFDAAEEFAMAQRLADAALELKFRFHEFAGRPVFAFWLKDGRVQGGARQCVIPLARFAQQVACRQQGSFALASGECHVRSRRQRVRPECRDLPLCCHGQPRNCCSRLWCDELPRHAVAEFGECVDHVHAGVAIRQRQSGPETGRNHSERQPEHYESASHAR